MTATGIEKDINLPGPTGRERGMLLDAMQAIPPDELVSARVNRGWLGVEWLPWGIGNLSTAASDCTVVYDFSARDLPELLIQPAFLIWDALKCTTLSSAPEWLRSRVVQNMDTYVSAAFASELSTAAASGGLSIAGDATYTPVVPNALPLPLGRALANLEDHLGDTLHGAIGMIHLTPGLLTLAVGEGYVEWRDGQYRTPTGHVVVGDAGFDGSATPFGQSAADTGQAWIYATSMVWYAVSQINTTELLADGVQDTDITVNKNRPIAKRYGLVTWDPAATGAALVSLASTEGGGGGSGGGTASGATITVVADSAGNEMLAALNESRIGLLVFNDSTEALYLKYGIGATTTDFTVKILAAGYWEMPSPMFTGRIDGTWDANSTGAARITELV
jgi:hypothetical protein